MTAMASSPFRVFKAQNSKHKLSLEEWRKTTVSFDSVVGIYVHISFQLSKATQNPVPAAGVTG
jgi:hypothetical protein